MKYIIHTKKRKNKPYKVDYPNAFNLTYQSTKSNINKQNAIKILFNRKSHQLYITNCWSQSQYQKSITFSVYLGLDLYLNLSQYQYLDLSQSLQIGLYQNSITFISISLSNSISFSNRLSLSFSLKPTQSFSLLNRPIFPFPQIYSIRDLGVHRVLWF